MLNILEFIQKLECARLWLEVTKNISVRLESADEHPYEGCYPPSHEDGLRCGFYTCRHYNAYVYPELRVYIYLSHGSVTEYASVIVTEADDLNSAFEACLNSLLLRAYELREHCQKKLGELAHIIPRDSIYVAPTLHEQTDESPLS